MSTTLEQSEIQNAESLSFNTLAPRKKIVCYPETGIHNVPNRPPTRGGDIFDQYHKHQATIADNSENEKYKKSPQEMFDMKMQLKYGSPLVSECLDWKNKTEWTTTMRPGGVERGIIKYSKMK